MKNQAYHMTMLFDFYGEILTPRQKEFYDLYYNHDLSLSEIAQNSGITRQGVRDVIVRGEHILQELEEKTGLIQRFHTMKTHLNQLETASKELHLLAKKEENPELHKIATEISQLLISLQAEEEEEENSYGI